MIRLEHINKYYPTPKGSFHALKDISLHIRPGEIFGIIGRSGAGKSTLIRLLNALEKPSEGTVYIDQQAISALSGKALNAARQQMGMVFQHFNLLQSRTILQNVMLPMRIAGVPKAERKPRALDLLKRVGLEAHSHKYPAQLSGGQQQRVGIARALANHPKILLCDEATSALDPETTQSILTLLSQLAKEMGLTIVLITHSMDVIRHICDRVVVLDAGRVVEEGPVLDIVLHPQHPTTCALLSESGVDANGWQLFSQHSQGRIYRITYHGQEAEQPVISQLSREFGININILQGAVGTIKNTPYGQLVINIDADEAHYAAIEASFTAQKLSFECLSTSRA